MGVIHKTSFFDKGVQALSKFDKGGNFPHFLFDEDFTGLSHLLSLFSTPSTSFPCTFPENYFLDPWKGGEHTAGSTVQNTILITVLFKYVGFVLSFM